MAHLGDDVAAFVDGQLSSESARAVESHVEECETCRHAVRQQQQLKSRMRGVGHPEPPAHLVASLSTMPAAPPPHPPWWSRLLGSASFAVGSVLLGASMAVVAVAYAVSPTEETADRVAPPFDRFAATFTGSGVQPIGSLTVSAMAELDEHGWPCHTMLGDRLTRVAGWYENGGGTVALVYSDGSSSLRLFEQGGSLDPAALDGFARRTLADRSVWVRESRPRVVTWHADGLVYTIVTELDDRRLAAAIADLPRPTPEPDPIERVGDGLTRMSTWIGAA